MKTRLTVMAGVALLGGALIAPLGARAQNAGRRIRTAPVASNAAGADTSWATAVQRMVDDGSLRLRIERDDTLLPGRRMEQLTQYYKGLRVWGGGVSRQLDGARVVSVFGRVYDGFDLDVTPTLGSAAAADVFAGVGTPVDRPGRPELVVLPFGDGAASLVWVGEVMTRSDVVRLFVDAQTGAIVRRYSVLERQAPAAAIGHGVGVLGDTKKLSVMPLSGTFVASDPLRPPEIATYDLRGNLDRTVAVLNNELALAMSDLASNSNNDSWTDRAVVDAHSYAGYTYDYYYRRFGRQGFDNANHAILNVVHPVRREDVFSAPSDIIETFYLNAFYCSVCAGGTMLYGEGLPGGVYVTGTGRHFDYLAGALDVVAHELTHGVTDFTSRLEYVNESGALNEAFSDIMGTSVEFFYQPPGNGPLKADYLIGEDVVTATQGGSPNGLRSMSDPGLFDQPDHYSHRAIEPADDAHDNGGVHINSGIVNQAFYLAIEGGTNRTSGLHVQGVGGANREQIEKIFYRAFAQLMPSNADFSMARAITLQAAQDLYGGGSAAYNAVRDAWTAVGVQ